MCSSDLQVAALAGIPAPVVKAAKRQLREFEQRTAINPLQPDLFAALPERAPPAAAELPPPSPPPALLRLRTLDPDSLTPRQALDLLYELKKLA